MLSIGFTVLCSIVALVTTATKKDALRLPSFRGSLPLRVDHFIRQRLPTFASPAERGAQFGREIIAVFDQVVFNTKPEVTNL